MRAQRRVGVTAGSAAERGEVTSRWLVLAGVLALVVAGSVTLELWSDPPSFLHGPRRVVVTGLHWVQEHGLTTGAIGVLVAMVGVAIPVLLWYLDRRFRGDPQDHERNVMARRVRYGWIDCFLDRSLTRAVWLRLGLVYQPDALAPELAVHRRGRPAEPVPPGITIGELFEKLGGGLLILGTPGAGKTTLLLELARDLLDQADSDATRRVPVIFNLSSWALERRPLHEWLVTELITGYSVPRRTARRWVDQDQLLPLLDGLDEVTAQHRDACVVAINAFRGDHGLLPFAVCSRTADYQALTSRMRMDEAVEIQPPTDQQMNDYLAALGTSTVGLRDAMQADDELVELLRSPLLLSVAALAYQDRPAGELLAGSVGQRRKVLLDAYIRRMLEHRPMGDLRAKRRALHWLVWLARSMRDRSQTDFYLDRIQPDWVPCGWQRPLVHALPATAVGLAIGMLLELANWLIRGTSFTPRDGIGSGLIAGLAFGLAASGLTGDAAPQLRLVRFLAAACFALIFGLAATIVFGSATGAYGAVAAGLAAGIGLRLSGGLAAGLGAGLALGVAFWYGGGLVDGLAGGLAAGLIVGLTARLLRGNSAIEPVEQLRLRRSRIPLAFALAASLIAGLAFHPASGLAVGIAVLFVAGLTGGLSDERGIPNEGILRSTRHAVIAGMIGLLAIGLANVVVFGPASALLNGLAAGLAVGFIYGGAACLRHIVLRSLLVYNGVAPWRYVAFLDGATERLFLRRNGSGYLFVHRLLRDHFADMTSTTAAEY